MQFACICATLVGILQLFSGMHALRFFLFGTIIRLKWVLRGEMTHFLIVNPSAVQHLCRNVNIPLKTNKPRVDIYLNSLADRTSGKGDVLGNRLFCSSWKNITKFVAYIVAKEGQHLLLVRNLLNIVLLCSQSSLVRDISKALLRHFPFLWYIVLCFRNYGHKTISKWKDGGR